MASGSDDFNRANGATGYTTLSGYNAFSIVSNQVKNTTTSDAGMVVATQAADSLLQADYIWSTTGSQAGSLNVRMASNSSSANCYRLLYLNANINGGTTALTLTKRTGGTDAAMVRNGVTQTMTLAEGSYTFAIRAITFNGMVLVLGLVNGVVVLWAVDTSSPFTSSGLGTAECYNSTASAVTLDNVLWADQGVTFHSDSGFGTGGWYANFTVDGADATSTSAKALVGTPGANNTTTADTTVQSEYFGAWIIRVLVAAAGSGTTCPYVFCGGTDITPDSTATYPYGNGAGNNLSVTAIDTAVNKARTMWPVHPKVGLFAHSAGNIALTNWAKQHPALVAAIFTIDGAGDVDYQITISPSLEAGLDYAYQYDSTAASWDAAKATHDPYLIAQTDAYWIDLRRVPVLHYRANTDATFDDTGQDHLATSWGAQYTLVSLAGTHTTIFNNIVATNVVTHFDNANWTTALRPVVVLTDNRAITASASPSMTFSRAPLPNDILDAAPSSTGITVTLQTVATWVDVLGALVDVESDSHELARRYHVVTAAEYGATTLTWTLTSMYSAVQTGNIVSQVVADVDPNVPLDVAASTFNSTNTVTPHVLAGLTPTTNNGLVSSVVAKDATGAYSTAPSGWNLRVTNNTNQGKAMLDRIAYTTAGVAVPATNITPSAGDEYASITVVWRAMVAGILHSRPTNHRSRWVPRAKARSRG